MSQHLEGAVTWGEPTSTLPELAVGVFVDEETVSIEALVDNQVSMTFEFPNDGQDHSQAVRFLAEAAPQIIEAALDQMEEE